MTSYADSIYLYGGEDIFRTLERIMSKQPIIIQTLYKMPRKGKETGDSLKLKFCSHKILMLRIFNALKLYSKKINNYVL